MSAPRLVLAAVLAAALLAAPAAWAVHGVVHGRTSQKGGQIVFNVSGRHVTLLTFTFRCQGASPERMSFNADSFRGVAAGRARGGRFSITRQESTLTVPGTRRVVGSGSFTVSGRMGGRHVRGRATASVVGCTTRTIRFRLTGQR